ncbi:hypothetical protein COY16_05145 [Candidatus Roizmanbacteria bacterium CG_4_10_14_0_2_um_filter_39_13]|uniref:Chromosome partitioning protein ParB n=1 Tax=Candidatus Roizmanbacteria bacterium CG_4_10_14_0_2_um_filter_39_13 TaxID=1974825 RepID=A0A2M7TWB1_9BACT|nr:MAG: hypothetical protein COY16_05145 [Candidatus Roizmanbacteria bacterium CG_4_10_14_0_2_um_filter_39_13]
MRKQYHFKPSINGFYAWDVDKLATKSKNLPHIVVPLDVIKELDENYWFQGPKPTCRAIVDHMHLIEETDLKYPIILSANGRVMDGMHRVAKALLQGHTEIKVVQFVIDPEPDYVDVKEEDLPY